MGDFFVENQLLEIPRYPYHHYLMKRFPDKKIYVMKQFHQYLYDSLLDGDKGVCKCWCCGVRQWTYVDLDYEEMDSMFLCKKCNAYNRFPKDCRSNFVYCGLMIFQQHPFSFPDKVYPDKNVTKKVEKDLEKWKMIHEELLKK